MLKKAIGIFTALTLIAGIICLPTSAADITSENFEDVTAVSDICGSGKLITTATAGNDKLAIESETNGLYTNKYLSFSGASQQIVTGITLKEGKNVISMRIKFSSGCNELIALRGGGSANTYVLSGMQSTIRLLHDSSKTVALNTGSWYNLHMIIDTTNNTIDESLSREGSNEWTTHSKTYAEGSNDAKNITAGGAVRIEVQGSDKLCIDDIKVSTVNESRYIVSESFNQFSAGEQGVAANKAISSHTGLMSTVANSVTTETDNGNTYLKLNGGTGILYGLNLFSEKQIWEMDIKLAPTTHTARIFLNKSGGASLDLAHFKKADEEGNPTVKVLDKYYIGDWVNKLKTDFVRFTFVIDRQDTLSVSVYADGKFIGHIQDQDAGFNNIRFSLNEGYTLESGETADQSSMYIDNIGCYILGDGNFNAIMPEIEGEVDVRNELKVTVTSNNMIDPASFDNMTLDNDGVIIAECKDSGCEYDLIFSGLKPETEYKFTGAAVTDIYGQTLGSVEDISFSTGKVDRTETVYVSSEGSDANQGSEESPFKTIQKAYSLYDTAKIVVLDDITENISASEAYTGEITIEGKEKNVKLMIATDTNLNGDLTIDNITLYSGGAYPGIYACGHKLVIGRGVTTETNTETNKDMRFSVYGGKKLEDTIGDTNITVLGGQYSMICGGGNHGAVTGDTNVIIGGTVNAADSVKDSETNYYASYACGGGNSGAVSGTTNITLNDSAKMAYIFGSGYNEGATSAKANVTVNGGEAMNVYGGALNANITADVRVIMNDGTVEGIFGGNYESDITGKVFIEVNGGEVTRRIYSGSYGGTTGISDGTVLIIKPDVKLCTGTGLSFINMLDSGIYGGSRGISANETNTVICTGGSGDKLNLDNKGWDYILKATTGGTIALSESGEITITRDEGMRAEVNGTVYEDDYITPAEGITNIVFKSESEPIPTPTPSPTPTPDVPTPTPDVPTPTPDVPTPTPDVPTPTPNVPTPTPDVPTPTPDVPTPTPDVPTPTPDVPTPTPDVPTPTPDVPTPTPDVPTPTPDVPTPTPTAGPDKITVDEEINIVKVPESEISPAKARASINMYVPSEMGEQETIFILAVYKDNVLQSIKYINEKVIGDKLFEAETDIVESGITVKAMLWDGKMKPFVSARSLEF